MTPYELCKSKYTYNKDTGELRSIGFNTIIIGPKGRVSVNYFGKSKPATHVIWYWMTGKFPEKDMVIDHINRIPSDNRWRNLRKITRSENSRNTKRSTYGAEFIANVNFNSDSFFLGYYKTQEEADKVMDAAYARVEAKDFNPLEL